MLMIVAGFQVVPTSTSKSRIVRGFLDREWGLAAIAASFLLIAFLWRAIDVGHGAAASDDAYDATFTTEVDK